ncbi:hypothetical protein CVT26_009406 [Gymnopilus dilepis]|uniref:Protein kinase domain-containing protein n=1 Tax=Gymnopilus dilepis TaxID=231916 RepID=A0A409VK54_9AGAR|nr:hypothetical protein CVT26_009406 [Gymnopilus dilepis]
MSNVQLISPNRTTVIHSTWDVLSFLNQVKHHLGSEKHTFGLFLTDLAKWLDTNNSRFSRDGTAYLLNMASLLRCSSRLVDGLNSVLALIGDQRVVCSTNLSEVKYIVLHCSSNARVFSTTGPEAPAHSCLRELAARSILPPSIFVNNVSRGDGHAIQGGAFADIYKGEMMGKPVCLRVLRMFDTPEENRQSLYKASAPYCGLCDFCSEVLVWRQLRHPNILPFIGADLDLFSPRFCFVSPWMCNGDIMSFLKQHPEHDRFCSIREIVDGIDYLHGLDPPVTHKDIKGTNVLVKDDLVCCLADFGLSSIVESQDLCHSPAFQGSVCWMAPELLDPSLCPRQNPRAGDIYALACTIYEIYTGKAPFINTKKTSPAIILAVIMGERPALPPPGSWTAEEDFLWWLVGLCWQGTPEARPEIHLIKKELRDMRKDTEKVEHIAPSDMQAPVNAADPLSTIQTWLKQETEEMDCLYGWHQGGCPGKHQQPFQTSEEVARVFNKSPRSGIGKVSSIDRDVTASKFSGTLLQRQSLPGQRRQNNIKYGARPQDRRHTNLIGMQAFTHAHVASPLS